MAVQLGGDGEELSATPLANKLATTSGVQRIRRHYLIRSSPEDGSTSS
jgi:hypothetical protein